MATLPPPGPPPWQLAQVLSPGAPVRASGGFRLEDQTINGMRKTMTRTNQVFALRFFRVSIGEGLPFINVCMSPCSRASFARGHFPQSQAGPEMSFARALAQRASPHFLAQQCASRVYGGSVTAVTIRGDLKRGEECAAESLPEAAAHREGSAVQKICCAATLGLKEPPSGKQRPSGGPSSPHVRWLQLLPPCGCRRMKMLPFPRPQQPALGSQRQTTFSRVMAVGWRRVTLGSTSQMPSNLTK